MKGRIAFGYEQETPEAKARWFASLSVQERIDLFNELTRLVLDINPDVVKKKHDRPTGPGVRVLKLA